MGFWRNIGRTIKRWLSGGNSQRSTPPAPRVNYINRDARNQTVSSNTGINRRAFLDSFKDGGSDSRSGEKEEKRVQDSFKASKYSYKSMADSNKESSFEKLDKALKKDVPDPKEAARQKAQKNAKAYIEHSKKGVAEFHERTGHKYDTRTGDKEHDKQAARLVKGGFAYSDPEAEKNAVKYHPIATSAARGAASGATFGATELAIKKTSKNDKERAEAEKYYQENKNKGAEIAGEVLGSLASFGGTAGATEKAGAKLVGKVAPNAAERLAQTELIQNAAKRGVSKAVKKGLVKEASEELVKQVGKDKAKKIVAAVGTDIVQNLTTGAIYDINRASTEYAVGSPEWWKEIGKSAAFNAAITGGIAGGSILKGNKKAAVEAADELGRLGKAGFVKQAPDAKVSLKRRRKTDVVLPNRRPIDAQVDAALDDMIEQASTVEDFMALGLSRGDAELLARPIRVADTASEEVRYNPFLDGMDSAKGVSTRKGNIKNLKEKLKTDELLPRNRNTQYVSTPRSVERVDTSVEGLSKRLDELRAQTPQTDKEKRALETKIHDVEDRLNRAEWRKEGGANMDAMRKAYAGEYAGFDMSKSTNSHQSDVLEGKVKGKTATIVEMSPDEYMERAYRQIFKKPSAKGARFAEMPENNKDIEKYAEAMRNGEKFPLPYLDFTNAGQEGRHRALAAKMAGIDKIPVVIIDDATNPKALIDEVAEATAKGANSWQKRLADADDFEAFVQANRNDPDVRAYVVDERNGMGGLEKLWRDARIAKHKQNIREVSLDESDAILERSLPNSTRLEWFQNQDSQIKPKLAHYIARDPDVMNAGMSIAYHNYADSTLGKAMPFDEWLVTPQKMYRGTHGQELLDEDIFSAFTPDRRVAQKYAGKGVDSNIEEITVRPIDTLGSYAVSGEQEILVPQEVIESARGVTENLNPKEAQTVAEKYNLDDVIPFTNDTPTVPKRGVNGGGADDYVPASVEAESIPTDDLKGLRANDARAELEDRVEELGKQAPNPNAEEPLKVNKIAPDEPISKDLPSGVKQVRSAYEYNNGEKIEGGTLTKWKEAWNASKEYSKSHATGEKVRQSKVAVTQLNAMDSEAERALREQLVASGDLNYEAISTPELYDKVAKQLRDDADHYIKEMIEINEGGALDFRSTPEWQARVQYILGTVDPSADEASEIAYTEAFRLAQNISSKGGQVLNLRRNFVHLTPLGKRDAILDDFINILSKSKGFRKNHPALNSLGKFDQRNYIRAFLMEDEGIMNGVQKVVEANELDDVSEAFTELMLKVNEKNPHTAFDVVQEIRYLNMLGNPKTHIRNIFGSGFFSPMRQISNAIRAGIEDPIAKAASKEAGVKMEVAKHGGISLEALKEANTSKPTTEAGKAAKEAFERMRNEILGSAKYETTMQKGRGRTLAGKALDAVSDFNSNLLAKEDDFFKSRAFKENYIKSYNRYLKDGKPITPKVKKQIEQEALQEAQIATFNEYNEFAKWLSNITRKANDENASAMARWGARGVNAVIPFTKVPANLMKQSINYSPIGIAKGMLRIKQAAKQGDAQLLNRAIDDLASGLTGTGVFGLGMLLGKTTDMFTTNAGKNDPAAKFKKDRGMQNYSITFKDPETGQGHSFTLDWLVPMSATFFSGIEMANQLKTGDFNIMDIGNDWSTVMTRLAEPVMETSMLSGLHGMLETMRGGSDSDDDKSAIQVLLRETAQSYVSSMIPTLLGQAARTAYKSDMQITGDDDWQYFWNQTKYKAGLANTNILGEPLGADTDAYGNVKGDKGNTLIGAIKEGDTEALANYGKAALKNFLSPANIQKVDFSEVDNEKLRTYEEAVKNGADPEEMAYLFPKKQYKKQFKLAGENVPMTNRELSTYNQAKTTGGEEGMRFILENIMFNRYDYDEKGNKVPLAESYTKEQKESLMQQFKGKSMREVEQWLYQQPEFKSATDAERKKAIEGLWKLTKDSNAVASQRVGERAVYEAQGKDGYEYDFKNEVTEKKREALQPAIDSGLLTYQDIVDFERNGGKVSYSDEDGGSATTYYSKKSMIEYFVANGVPYEKAEALFNAYKNKNAKPYSGNNLSSGYSGRRRRGYGGYRRSGGSSKTVTPPEIKQSSYKASKQTYKSMAETLKTSPQTNSAKVASVKVTPPKVKFKKYEV